MPPTTIEDMVQHLNGLVGLTREEIDLLNEPPGKSPSYPSSTTGSVMSSYPPSVEPQRSRKPSALFHHERADRPSSLPGRRIDRILPSGRSRTPMMLSSSSYAANLPPDLRPSQLLQPPPDTSSDEEEDSRSNIREEYLPNMEDVMRLGPMKYEAMATMFADLSELPSIDETSTDVMIAANRKWSASSSSSSQSKPRISSSSASSASGSRATPTGRLRTRHEHYV
uniref:Uncharacterized protein n=2 Tax=Ciona savignyi TaxID=51511 RepID=H2YNS0_CIOSA